jgi:predicted PurR-regulated permease PerM
VEEIRFSPRAKVIVVWIILILAVLFVYRVRDIAMPFFSASVTAYIFHPLVKWLAQKTRVPKVIWITLLYLAVGGLIAWGIAVLVPAVGQQYQELIKAVPGIVTSIQDFIRQNSQLQVLGFTLDLETISDQLVNWLGNLAGNLPGQALAAVQLAFGTVFSVIIFLVATFYLLLFGERWTQGFMTSLPPQAQAELLPLLRRIHMTVTAYLRAQLLRIAFVSIVLGITLSVLQVRFAILLALIGGVLDIVPILGPNLSAAITILVTLFQPAPFGWSHITLAIVIVVIYLGMNQVEENIVLPPLIGYLVDLPPLVVLFAVLAGESIAGILGLLLAVPIAASLKIVLRYLYAKLMDKPVIYEEPVRQRLPRRWRREKKK